MLSKETQIILKNLIGISDSIIMKYPITNINMVDKSVIAFVDLTDMEEPFDDFGIFEMGKFLNLLSFYPEANVELKDDIIHIKTDKTHQKYVTTHIDNLEPYDISTKILENIGNAPKVAEFNLTKEDLENVKKISSLLKLPDFSIKAEGDKIFRIVHNSSQKGMNDNKTIINNGEIFEDFELNINIDQIIKLPSIDYNILVAKNPKTGSFITLWTSENNLPIKIVVSTKSE